MEHNQSSIINLFDTIPSSSQEELDLICENLSEAQSLFFIIQALEFCYHKGVFSLTEAELVSKSIRTLNSRPKKTNESKKDK
jgi:hypothetical protein